MNLLDAVRPVLRKAAAQRKIAGGRRGVAAGTGMVQCKRRDGSLSRMTGSRDLDDYQTITSCGSRQLATARTKAISSKDLA